MFDVFHMPDAECTKLQEETSKHVPGMWSMLVSQELGRRILALRLARDLSQEDLEERAPLRAGRACRMEQGLHDAKVYSVLVVCRGLQAHPTDLCLGIVHRLVPWVAEAIPLRPAEVVNLCEATVARHIGDRVKAERLRLRLTQAQLASRATLSLSTVQRTEEGITLGQLTPLCTLASCFGLELNDLLPPPPPTRNQCHSVTERR